MADDIDALLAAKSGDDGDIDALLSARAAASETSPTPAAAPQSAEIPWYKQSAMGFGDQFVGPGQLMQNILPDAVMNVARKAGASVAGAAGVPSDVVESVAAPRSTEEFNQMVRQREGDYQAERKAAGQQGFDWWRTGGMLANPLSWLGPSGEASTAMQAVKLGAQQGAFQALLQPVTSEGNFLYDKGVQEAVGATVGGTLGAALYALRPVFHAMSEKVRGVFSKATVESQEAAAAKMTDDAFKAVGADPAKVDPNLYSAMQTEVRESLSANVEPNAKVMERRADALALDPPVRPTRAELLRDPMAYAKEHRLRGMEGVGEDLTQRRAANNRALIQNLNNAGASRALEPFDLSQGIINHIETLDDAFKGKINEAYAQVRDSAGRSARLSNDDFARLSREALTEGKPDLAHLVSRGDYIPAKIRDVYNDIVSGKLPLTVDTVQFLDRNWGAIQRAAPDDEALAIGTLRRALNETPVNDSLGQESMAAYAAAKKLAKQRFDLIDSIPAYKQVVEGKAEPDKFFQKYIQGANVSELSGLKRLIGPENTAKIQDTVVGNLKRIALNRASDENGVFSQAAYNKVLQDPVQGPRLGEIFSNNRATLDRLYRVGRVSENLIKVPDQSIPNVSGSAIQGANIIRDVAKSEASASLTRMIPIAGRVLDVMDRRANAQAVQEAVNPGVTQTALRAPAPGPTMRRLSDLLTKAGAASVSAAATEDEE